ncbi:MAG: ion transporter [Rhodobacteraceae bacterium]|nr:ion transporter [Paracoccaceae bacterium]MCY4251423.1 ion transporter [Paracoccaceae bacterium]MCY4309451.1 ion transporter [Paracoccaceae bacterium]
MTILPEPNNSINRFRQRLGQFIESPRITRIITVLIVINAITLGLETSSIAMERIGSLLLITDKVLLTIFAVELCIKLFAFGWRFFTTGWNIFDFVIIGIALVPSSGNLSVLRSLRILRGLRLITYIPSMRRVVAALMASIPGISSVIALMALVYYIFGVMVTKLFGEVFPTWFGTIGKSMYSLFQIMTLESWSMGIVRPVMEVFPYAWIVFVPFILITSFAVINLFIAVIVNAMTEQGKLDSVDPGQDRNSVSEYEHQALVKKIEDLKEQLDEIKVIVAKR